MQKFSKKSICKVLNQHFHFWPFSMALEKFFAEGYLKLVSGAF